MTTRSDDERDDEQPGDDGGRACLPCLVGLHSECDATWEGAATSLASELDCCCTGVSPFDSEAWAPKPGLDLGEDGEGPEGPREKTPVDAYFEGYTGTKNPSDYVDPKSTGRKEAARKFPIKPGMKCEWAHMMNNGGGVRPIVGCPGYPASDIHHGPDKNTLKNVEGNVHRICVWCHNRWHALNDPHYPAERPPADQPFIPLDGKIWGEHNPQPATDDEIFAEEKKRREDARTKGNL